MESYEGMVEVVTGTEYYDVTWSVAYEWEKEVPATYLDPPEGGMSTYEPEPIMISFYFDNPYYCVDIDLTSNPDFAAVVARECKEPCPDRCRNAAEEDMDCRFGDQ